MIKISYFLIILGFSALLQSCGIYKKVDVRERPVVGMERAKQNIEQGRGVSIGNVMKRSTSYEFSTSNPMWRSTLEVLDFIPLSTIDYSGGLIISDWYNDDPNNNEYIKITVRFLSNEIQATNLRIIVHKKKCDKNNLNSCLISKENSVIIEEFRRTILSKAVELEKQAKSK